MPEAKYYIDRKDSIPVSMSYFLHEDDADKLLSKIGDLRIRLWFYSDLNDHAVSILTDILSPGVEYPLVSMHWSKDYDEYRMFVYPIKKESRAQVQAAFWEHFARPMAEWLVFERDEMWKSTDQSIHALYDTGSGLLRSAGTEDE